MRLCLLGLLYASLLHAQPYGRAQPYGPKEKGFDFTEACFRNPALPYCPNRDLAPKPTAKGGPAYGAAEAAVQPSVDAAGIDWRFADPAADSLAVLDCSQFSASPVARELIVQFAAVQGLNPAQAQDVLRALSGVSRIALSVHQGATLMMVAGRPPDAVLPALDSGWKALPLAADAVLIGPAAAVDEAARRLATGAGLAEFPLAAQHRPAGAAFWMIASAKLAPPEAVSAGAKQFDLAASLDQRLSAVTSFHFEVAPDPAAIRPWLNTLGGVSVQGETIRARFSIDASDLQQDSARLAATPLGAGLAAVIRTARYLPLRDTAATVHTRPVIYGLDDGPREVK